MTKHNPGEWAKNHPEVAPKKHRTRLVLLILVLGAVLAIGLAVALSGSSSTSYNTPTHRPALSQSDASRDVNTSLTAPDAIGVVYVKYSITNHSSKTSDYHVSYDVTTNGVRVTRSDIFETSVDPGETVTGQSLTTASTNVGSALKVKVDRSATLFD